MSHDAPVGLVLLGVVSLGAVALWAIRRKASAWADQHEKADEAEKQGLEGDYPIIGRPARRLSRQEASLLLAGVIILLAALTMYLWSDIVRWDGDKTSVREHGSHLG